jgi:hypothetical protein
MMVFFVLPITALTLIGVTWQELRRRGGAVR